MISPKNLESTNQIELNSSPMQKFAEHVAESNANTKFIVPQMPVDSANLPNVTDTEIQGNQESV